jgi:hypothetical protein
VPVPTFIAKNQIGVVNTATIDHLDAYTAPRLVQYYDPDPCTPPPSAYDMRLAMAPTSMAVPAPQPRAYAGVKIEAQYDIAEYDVSILSAEQGNGLINYLNDNGYQIPAGAGPVIGSYIKQKMHFFIAKVNVKRLRETGRAYLRPLQVRYKTAKFMLPLRLGTVNANGPQDLLVYAVTRRGRIEASNYRTVKVPSDIDVPLFVENDFPNFYKAAFERAVARQDGHGVFVEYAWNLNWCDPCAAKPMSQEELSELGARWLAGGPAEGRQFLPSGDADAFVTRLHVRYDAKSFPEDLNFVETADRENFQARYVMHHPFVGATCGAANVYRNSLPARFRREATNAADLTGWQEKDIESRMALTGQPLSGIK